MNAWELGGTILRRFGNWLSSRHALKKPRDLTLDMAKGLAIMLVILGHIFQDQRPDFDNSWGFRLIYSFHMPLFIFLSGAVTAIRVPPMAAIRLSVIDRCLVMSRSIMHSAGRLLVPFLTWTIINWAMGTNGRTLGEWMLVVLRSTDNSLWFLLTVFQLLFLWFIWQFIMGVICEFLRHSKVPSLVFFLEPGFLSLFLFWIFAKSILALLTTNYYGIGFLHLYLSYFILGALYYHYGRGRAQGLWRAIPYIGFGLLVPFWYRTQMSPIADWLHVHISQHIKNQDFHFVVALCGTFVVLDIVRILRAADISVLNRVLAYCGTASLGIYAMQGYLLGYHPVFIAPLTYCLLAYAVISRIPVARFVLLGERAPAKQVMPTQATTSLVHES